MTPYEQVNFLVEENVKLSKKCENGEYDDKESLGKILVNIEQIKLLRQTEEYKKEVAK